MRERGTSAYRELKLLSFDLDALCVNSMLNRLPKLITSFVDGVWTLSENRENVHTGRIHYLVKWLGYEGTDEHTSWSYLALKASTTYTPFAD